MTGIERIVTSSAADTQRCGESLARLLKPGDVVLLTGDLGAGKTVVAKGVAAGLGVREPVTSPTFNIMLVHEGRIPLYHFDLYRLESAEQLEDVDYFATLEADGVSVVEWGDRFGEAMPSDGLLISMQITADEDRTLSLRPLGPRGEALARDWSASCRTVSDEEASAGG